MCNHTWVPLEAGAIHPVSINTGTIYTGQTLGFRTTKIICIDCKEIRLIAESPYTEAMRLIDEYQLEIKKKGDKGGT